VSARLAYTVRGAGEPLVLIMGLGATGEAWDLHARAFAARFRCFLVDNRGAGGSEAPPGPYTTAAMADDYAALIRSLGLGAVRAVGISMGGAIAQELALRHPDLVRSLVLACTWGRCDGYTRRVFEHFADARAALSPAQFVRLLQLWIWSPHHVDRHEAELRAAEQEAARAWMPLAAFEAQCHACVTHDTLDRLGALAAPTLITAGARDVFTPPALSHELAAAIPGAELRTFAGAGHAHHWEVLDEWNAAVSSWLANH
jgi:pimeloyl-ACP methyl ester carboxylesterase